MSASAPGITELVERLEKATGPDRELDRDIQAWLCEHCDRWSVKRVPPDANGENASEILMPPSLPEGFTYPPKGAIHRHYHVPSEPVTKSIDAAWALVWKYSPASGPVTITIAGSAQVVIDARDPCLPPLAQAFGRTPALALCLALLKALPTIEGEER